MRGLCIAVTILLAATAAAPAADRHLGVASCAGGTCHAATRPFPDSRVRQDEYFTWQRRDRHAKAWQTLTSERSARIAGHLGIANAAESPRCLTCHADAVDEKVRGERFQLADGIGCEACHGGAERWLEPHVRGFASADQRRSHGMTATEDPAVRARLCLSCHQGDDARPMTHAIMAAGHPPLLFELDTFGVLQPAHYDVDDDYRSRKGAQDPFRTWLAGQLQAVQVQLEGIGSKRFDRGLMPELAFFDCAACHHSMEARRAAPRPGLPAGEVPFADASFEMVEAWLEETAPDQARRWREQWTALHHARGAGAAAVQRQARAMADVVRKTLQPRLAGDIDAARVRGVLRRIVKQARAARGGDFAYAQQTAMASLVMIGALHARDADAPARARVAVDKVYAAARDADRFSVRTWRNAVDELAAALK